MFLFLMFMLWYVSVLHSFLWLNHIVWMDHILCIHLPLDGHLNCVHLLAVRTSAAVNMPVFRFLCERVSFLLGGVELLGLMVTTHLTF